MRHQGADALRGVAVSHEERAWSRALVASTGVPLDHDRRAAGPHHEWLEAGAADLARPRLLEFASHRDVRIRETIALRPDCPMGVLATLAFDADPVVRRAVASSARLVSAVAAELARDRDRHVLEALARNPLATREVLLRLVQSRRSEVRRHALATLMQLDDGASMAAAAATAIPAELADRWAPAQTSPPPDRTAPRVLAPRPTVPRPRPRQEPLAAPVHPPPTTVRPEQSLDPAEPWTRSFAPS